VLSKIEQVARACSTDRFQGTPVTKPEAIHLGIGVEDNAHVERSEIVETTGDSIGDRFLYSYVTSLNLTAPGGLERLLDQHSIRWTLLSPGTPALEVLDRLPGWQRLYSDSVAVVHTRSR
jgi:hypothetical protein